MDGATDNNVTNVTALWPFHCNGVWPTRLCCVLCYTLSNRLPKRGCAGRCHKNKFRKKTEIKTNKSILKRCGSLQRFEPKLILKLKQQKQDIIKRFDRSYWIFRRMNLKKVDEIHFIKNLSCFLPSPPSLCRALLPSHTSGRIQDTLAFQLSHSNGQFTLWLLGNCLFGSWLKCNRKNKWANELHFVGNVIPRSGY